jgi:hypothetical protein
MGEEKSGGCLQVGCALWVISSIITLLIFFISNDSIDEIQELTLSDVAYYTYMPSSWSYMSQKQYENKHNHIVSLLKKDGIDVGDEIEDLFDDNKFLDNVSFSKEERKADRFAINSVDIDIVTLSAEISDKYKSKVKLRFIVKPKSFINKNFTELGGFAGVKINSEGKSLEIDDPDKIISFLAMLSNSEKTQKYLKNNEIKIYDFDRTIETYGGK